MTDLTLYGHPDSGHACKVALALALAGLPYKTVWVDIWAPPATRPTEFLAGSPFAEVPLLTIDGAPYVQSGAILLEIASRFRCLGGDSAAGLRRARELIVWEANRIGMCLPQLRFQRLFKSDAFTAPTADWLKDRFAVDRDSFTVLLGDAPFFHGDRPGIGDCAIWGYAQWVEEADVEPSEMMADWLQRMRELPAMKTPEGFFPRS